MNVNPALDFFPDQGTDPTFGTVLVEEQYLTIGTSAGASYNFYLSGEGIYRVISVELTEIALDLSLTNDEILGGTVTSKYFLYNKNSYEEPNAPTNAYCVTPYDL